MKNNKPKPKNKILMGPMVIKINEDDIPYVYFSSDHHHSHANILNFTQRGKLFSDLDNMSTAIFNNIQEIYNSIPDEHKYKAIFFHCGDILFGSKGKAPENFLNITKQIAFPKVYAVLGNHDIHNILRTHDVVATDPGWTINDESICIPNWYWNNMYIVEIYRNSSCICSFTVSHFPMALDEFHGQFNVHGHLHSRPHEYVENENSWNTMQEWASTGKHFDCGVDNNNYKPVSLLDIMAGKTTIKTEYKLNNE